jgi:sarcosine oxidase subunit beta
LCLSELVIDGATPIPLGPFSIRRFKDAVEVSEKFQREFDRAPDQP